MLELDTAENAALNGGALSLAVDGDTVLLDEFGLQHRFEHLPPLIKDDAVDAIAGDYVCGAVSATAIVDRLSADKASLRVDGPVIDACYNLARKGQSIWISRAVDNLPRPNCLVEFNEDTLWLSSLRTTRLCFKRAVCRD